MASKKSIAKQERQLYLAPPPKERDMVAIVVRSIRCYLRMPDFEAAWYLGDCFWFHDREVLDEAVTHLTEEEQVRVYELLAIDDEQTQGIPIEFGFGGVAVAPQ